MRPTILAADLLLLALDDERGTVLPQAAIGLDFGLAGAVTMDLALRGAIRMERDAVFATATSADDALLDEARRIIADAPGKRLSHWVQHLSRDLGGLRQRIVDRLVSQGALEKRDTRVLLLFHRTVYPERNARVEHDIRARINGVLFQGAVPDPETNCLIHLAAACRVTDEIYPKARHRAIKARIAELDDVETSGINAVNKAVAEAEAAMMAAVMVASIAATTTATAAACASSAACS